MTRVNWWSVLSFGFMLMSGAAMVLATMTQAVAFAVLAVAAAILAHLR